MLSCYGTSILIEMDNSSKIILFEQTPIGKAVAKLAVPTILSSLVMVLYNLADTYFVGILNDPVQNAAVALAAPVLLAFNAINNLFGIGSSSMMSRALGSRNYENAYRSSAFGFYCALLCGLIFSTLCTLFNSGLLTLLGADSETAGASAAYIKWTVCFGATPAILNVVLAYMVRAEGASLHASIGTMSGCFFNILLDPLFILPGGLNMGAEGAALATFLSNCVACCYFFVLLFVRRRTTYVCLHPKRLAFRKEIASGIFAVGIPASVQNLLNVTGMTILNHFASEYGASAVGAMGIAQKINMVPFQVALGLSQGIMPLVSYNYASGNYKRMKGSVFFAGKITVAFLTGITVLFLICARPLTALFIDNGEMIAYGAAFLRGFCLCLPFLALDFLAVGVFQAVGKGMHSLLFAVIRKIAAEIPALFLLNRLFPLYGLPYAQVAAECIMASAAVLVLGRMFKRWSALYSQEDGKAKGFSQGLL